MNQKCVYRFVFLVFTVVFGPAVQAKTESKSAAKTDAAANSEVKTGLDENKLNYPELEVTPRASERLEIEAKYEARHRWGAHIPIQFSALATLYAATSVNEKPGATADEKDELDTNKTMALGVSSGWLVLTATLSGLYRPYYQGYKQIVKMPKSNSREELTRERLAEEALYAPEGLATKLKWFSVITNFAVSAQLLKYSDTDSKLTIGIATVASLAPLLFESRWTEVSRQHREYKKKIYGPITSLIPLDLGNRQQLGLGFQWSFE